jgi:RNA polymerase-interacting CarD/CdnL/TRCF family regulator
MAEQEMTYRVGDKVSHWAYGLGEITELDEKELFGRTSQYYVVRIRDITLWVPINEKGERCLRFLTPAEEFPSLLGILTSPAEPLSQDGLERKNQLSARLREGSLSAICALIRDLIVFQQEKKINDSEKSILERARRVLLDEWCTVLSVPLEQAESQLQALLASRISAGRAW